MTITRQKKEEILKDLESDLRKAKLVVFVNFHGLNVSASQELRKLLKTIGVRYLVTKKTLIKKVLNSFKFGGEIPALEEEIALAISENENIEAIKALENFTKKNEKIKLLGGIFENKYLNKETIVFFANIPPKEVLLGQLVNVINSPIQGLVVILNGVIRNFISVLNQISAKGGSALGGKN